MWWGTLLRCTGRCGGSDRISGDFYKYPAASEFPPSRLGSGVSERRRRCVRGVLVEFTCGNSRRCAIRLRLCNAPGQNRGRARYDKWAGVGTETTDALATDRPTASPPAVGNTAAQSTMVGIQSASYRRFNATPCCAGKCGRSSSIARPKCAFKRWAQSIRLLVFIRYRRPYVVGRRLSTRPWKLQ